MLHEFRLIQGRLLTRVWLVHMVCSLCYALGGTPRNTTLIYVVDYRAPQSEQDSGYGKESMKSIGSSRMENVTGA